MDNGTMMQYFESFMKSEPSLWASLKKDADKLAKAGVSSVWLPPAYKGANGAEDTGYTVYDLYDLGEFNQKGSVRTKYGTKKDYLDAISELQKNGINVYADVVIDNMTGADEMEEVPAKEFNEVNRYQMISEGKTIGSWTKFKFPGRKD